MFEHIVSAPADPILGLNDAFKSDPRPNKINLGVGVFKDETGLTPVLSCVKEAEKRLLEQETSKGYLSITGSDEYGRSVRDLLFGRNAAILGTGRAVTVQAPGGTGALRVGADFLATKANIKRVWISNPTWANHKAIFNAAGVEVAEYRYYDADSKSLDFDAMLEDLAKVPAGEAVLLHGCCHNPTGVDPTGEQWQQLANLASEKGWLPYFDFAYQGFARGVEEDAEGLRLFVEQCPEMLIASSFSKNFGLYNERVGALTLIGVSKDQSEAALSQLKVIVRSNYSNPPAHGALVVTTVLNDESLRQLWLNEVADMRNRIKGMRDLFVSELKNNGVQQDFSFIARQNGMFSFSGLNAKQVAVLAEDFGIYMVNSGRMNVAGMTESNISHLCQSIAKVVS